MMGPAPRNAIRLTRISDARDEDTKGVDAQGRDCDRLAERIGWTFGPAETHHIIENDTSAFKRRKITLPDGRRADRTVRPGFREALAMLADGRADGFMAPDLDRAFRDPRDLEDMIDVIEASSPRIPVESVTGSLRLSNDAEITMARVMVAMANKSSRDTARRVARARQRQAEEGRWGGGKRPFGFEPDGLTIRASEAEEIKAAADAILSGVSLRQVTASLRDRGVPTVTGAAWNSVTVRDMLLRPRNAGLMVHRADGGRGPRKTRLYTDADVTGAAPWDAIIPEAQWQALRAILTDSSRTTGPGNTPRWLGSRLYLCGVCGDGTTMVVSGSTSHGHRYSRYICREEGHLARAAPACDEWVGANVTAYLARPDMADVLAPPRAEGPDPAGLQRDAASLRVRLDELANMHADGEIDGRQLAKGSARIRERLDAIEKQLAALSGQDPLFGLAGNPDAAELWESLDLGRKRAVLRHLAVVTIYRPSRPGGSRFDYETVVVKFHRN